MSCENRGSSSWAAEAYAVVAGPTMEESGKEFRAAGTATEGERTWKTGTAVSTELGGGLPVVATGGSEGGCHAVFRAEPAV